MPQHYHQFQIDYYGKGYLGVPAVAGHLQPPRDPFDDPWLVCALALEWAGQGNFGLMPVLVDLYGATGETAIDHMCLGLLTSAGTSVCFSRIVDRVMHEPNASKLFDLCGVLAVRAELSYIPLLLDKYLSYQGMEEAERLTDYIGALVGDQLFTVEADDYEDAVMSCYQRMLGELNDAKTLVFQGERYGVERLAKYILRSLDSPYFPLRWKLEFEAATGKDCSAWYRDRQLQPLAAAVTIEEFLESGEAARYEEGVRYFFGHRIDG